MEHVLTYILDAELAFREKRYMDGKQYLEHALALEPGYGKAHNHLGWLYFQHLDELQLAERHLKLALKYSPDYCAPYINFADLLFFCERWEELADILERAAEVKGVTKAYLHNEWGRWHEVKGNYRLALKEYRLAYKWCLNDGYIKTIQDNMARCRGKRKALFFSF